MTIKPEDIDGRYLVKSQTSEGGPFVVNGDGMTEIKNGLTYRTDKNGYTWESSFTIEDDGKIKMESTIDPSTAGGRQIKDSEGKPTSGIVTYRTMLDVSHEGNVLVFSGTIEHGGEVTQLKMMKLS